MAGNLDFRLNLLANTTGLQQGMNGAKFAVNALATAMATVGVGVSISGLVSATDTYTNLSARIQQATKDGGDFQGAMAGVHQVALMTNSSLQATGDLFTRLNTVGKAMGMTQQQALSLTKTVTQAIQIGGGSAQASEAAITQFIQAMQGGVLRGEEFNSIMENGYGLAEALAKGLSVTTGELRKMAENGELSAERVIKAVQKQATEVQATYDKFPTTIGNALQRISTSWDILIGKMDQSNGASATVAEWLVTLADNIAELDVILNDIGEGFVWVGDQLKKIDPSTIDALKIATISAYEVIKQMANTLGDSFEVTGELLNSTLGQLLDFDSGVDSANDKTNGFTKLLQLLNVALGFLNDGFAAVSIGVNLFAGALYSVASAWAGLVSKFTWGDVKADAIANMQAMQEKAEDFYKKASDGALKFESSGVKALNEISKTQDQKNQEVVASSKATLDQLLADQTTETESKKASEEDKLAAVKAYAEASIAANKGVMDGTMQADLMTKGYIVTLSEAGKVSVEASQSAEQATESATKKEENLKLAKENVKKADQEYLAFQKSANVERAALETQIEQSKKIGNLNELKQVQDKIDQINSKEAELANNRNLRITELNQATTGSAQIAEGAYSRASTAANQFGVDLDVSLNRISKSFNSSGVQLTELKEKLNLAGITGQKAANTLYQSWEGWLSKAKSQVEIDLAISKLNDFKTQGVISSKQVELGMQAVRQVVMKLPGDLDPVSQAFQRLGIQTKEQLRLAAESAIADFNTIQSSGKATADSLKQAYERVIQASNASGDAQVKAMANSKAASLGLSVEIDKTGKASVSAGDEISNSMHHARSSVDNLGNGFRNAGQIARQEAESAGSAWEQAVKRSQASNAEFSSKMKSQGESISKGIYGYNSYTKAEVLAQIKAKNYSDEEAEQLAGSIWNKGTEADKKSLYSGLGDANGNLMMDRFIRTEFKRAASNGLTTQHGTNAINDALRQLDNGSATSSVNNMAPSIGNPALSSSTLSQPKNSRLELVSGNKTAVMNGSQKDVNSVEEMLREFELIQKAT